MRRIVCTESASSSLLAGSAISSTLLGVGLVDALSDLNEVFEAWTPVIWPPSLQLRIPVESSRLAWWPGKLQLGEDMKFVHASVAEESRHHLSRSLFFPLLRTHVIVEILQCLPNGISKDYADRLLVIVDVESHLLTLVTKI